MTLSRSTLSAEETYAEDLIMSGDDGLPTTPLASQQEGVMSDEILVDGMQPAGSELQSPTETSELLRADTDMDPAADQELELEADAESIVSSETGDGSDDEVAELQYFRFTRSGLSVFVDLSKLQDGQALDDPHPPPPPPPCLVDFEQECRQKYSTPIGGLVGRYSCRPPTETAESAVCQGAEVTSKTEVSGDVPDAAPESDKKQPNLALSSVVNPERQQDRLSTVINDILYRLNRQGVLADPRDVCRKGGGRSGEYYEKDDTFFDDSLAFENLGMSPTSLRSPRPSPRKVSRVLVLDDDDDAMEGDDGSVDENEEDWVYDYHDLSEFRFDNDPTRDDEDLPVSESPMERGAASPTSESDASSDPEAFGEKQLDKYVTTRHWVRRHAWRALDARLPKDMVEIFKKLEDDLKGKGDKRGLFVDPRQILCCFRGAMESIFCTVYPGVAWNIAATVNTYSVATEAFMEQRPPSSKTEIPLPAEKPSVDVQKLDTLPSMESESDCETAPRLPSPHAVAPELKEKASLAELLPQPPPAGDKQDDTTPQPPEVKKPRKRASTISHAAPLASVDDLVPLTWPYMSLMSTCLMKMSSLMQPHVIKRLWTARLVLHNQMIYSCLEAMVCHAVVKKSPLFRTKGAVFFRNLKKAVDAYLKKLSHHTSANQTSQQPPLTGNTTTTASSATRTTQDGTATDGAAKASSDSPFAAVATDLLNWAIIYNCRRHELREIGETLEEWSAPFSTYVSSLLNTCIEKRRRRLKSPGEAATSKQSRIWIPAKFMEETLEAFRREHGNPALYEKRPKKPVLPTFVQPCKAIFPVVPTRTRKTPSKKPHPTTTAPVSMEKVSDAVVTPLDSVSSKGDVTLGQKETTATVKEDDRDDGVGGDDDVVLQSGPHIDPVPRPPPSTLGGEDPLRKRKRKLQQLGGSPGSEVQKSAMDNGQKMVKRGDSSDVTVLDTKKRKCEAPQKKPPNRPSLTIASYFSSATTTRPHTTANASEQNDETKQLKQPAEQQLLAQPIAHESHDTLMEPSSNHHASQHFGVPAPVRQDAMVRTPLMVATFGHTPVPTPSRLMGLSAPGNASYRPSVTSASTCSGIPCMLAPMQSPTATPGGVPVSQDTLYSDPPRRLSGRSAVSPIPLSPTTAGPPQGLEVVLSSPSDASRASLEDRKSPSDVVGHTWTRESSALMRPLRSVPTSESGTKLPVTAPSPPALAPAPPPSAPCTVSTMGTPVQLNGPLPLAMELPPALNAFLFSQRWGK